MTLQSRIALYLVAIHLLLGAVAFYALLDRPWLLIGAEVVFAASALTGYALAKSFFVPLDLIRTGSELIRERDFSSHFAEVGQAEMDHLIRIYNTMIDQLREERRQVEERNLFLDKVLEASPSGVVTLGHDGTIRQINPAAARLVEGSAEGTEKGMHERTELDQVPTGPVERGAAREPAPASPPARGIEHDSQTARPGASGSSSMIGRHIDIFPPPVAASLRDLADGGSAVVAWRGGRRLRIRRGSFYDRGSDLPFFLIEELTEELRASEKAAYGKLIRMMSHEVNNSVGAVRSLLESCQSYGSQLRAEDRGDYDQALSVAARRLVNLNEFMHGLAEVVRIPPPDRRACDLPALMEDVATLVRPELGRRGIRLAWEAPQEFPVLTLDKNQIEQVLVNVLRNATEAIGKGGGTITMALSADGGRPTLTIRDTGGGIPPEAEAHLFTPFFSTKREGQGIGLTLVREILAQHALDFDLRNVGGGAEFRVFF